jgi:tetratricopeptide (TPR) repeat protein
LLQVCLAWTKLNPAGQRRKSPGNAVLEALPQPVARPSSKSAIFSGGAQRRLHFESSVHMLSANSVIRSNAQNMDSSDIGQLLRKALSLHQTGQSSEAEELYHLILAREPQQVDALRLLGILHRQRGRFAESMEKLAQALALRPQSAELQNDLGLLHYDDGKFDEAVAALSRSLEIDPSVAETHFNLGNAHFALEQFAEAKSCYERALERNPELADAHFNLGLIAIRNGNLARAIWRLFSAWRSTPGDDATIRSALDRARADYLIQVGAQWAGDAKDADADSGSPHDQSGTIAPSRAAHWAERALEAERQNDDTRAVRELLRAAANEPTVGHHYYNLGCVLHKLRAYPDAAAFFCLGILWNANPPESFHNLACSLMALREFPEAIHCYRSAIALDPNHPQAHYALACALLLRGEMKQGWIHYEKRPKAATYRLLEQNSGKPSWNGEDLKNRTLLVITEQGFGDAIQFVRFLPEVARLGGKVILGCHPLLKALLQTAPGIHEVVEPGEKLEAFDFHVLLMSLPRILNTELETIPKKVPYLKTPPGISVEVPVIDRSFLKVGLVWQGSPKKGDPRRSIPFRELIPLISVERCAFYSLQVDESGAEFSQSPFPDKLVDMKSRLATWGHTASVIEQMDLVISVDTGVAHLAGALARPVWVLLQYDSEWRWLLEREDSPWYPTMRLFRQKQRDDWVEEIERVRKELKQFAAGKR